MISNIDILKQVAEYEMQWIRVSFGRSLCEDILNRSVANGLNCRLVPVVGTPLQTLRNTYATG